MATTPSTAKTALRQIVRAKLKSLDLEYRTAASAQACARLEQQAIWREAKSVLCFAPLPGEVDIWRMVEAAVAAGKLTGLPRFDFAVNRYGAAQIRDLRTDIKTGQFGIREPADGCLAIDPARFELVLVPGVAFDLWGRRLGRGKGFYDQLLAQARGRSCGVAFDEQLTAEIPVEPHDASVDWVLTPTRWIEAQKVPKQ